MLDSGFALPAATFLLTLSHTRHIPTLRSGRSVECAQGNDDEKLYIEPAVLPSFARSMAKNLKQKIALII